MSNAVVVAARHKRSRILQSLRARIPMPAFGEGHTCSNGEGDRSGAEPAVVAISPTELCLRPEDVVRHPLIVPARTSITTVIKRSVEPGRRQREKRKRRNLCSGCNCRKDSVGPRTECVDDIPTKGNCRD